MTNISNVESIFDSLANKYVNDEEQTGGVILGIFSEDEELAFHAAHGDMATITALITAIIDRTAENADIAPRDLLLAISLALTDRNADAEDMD